MNDSLSFLLSDEVTKIFNHFTALFDIRIAYYTPDGRELAVGLDRSWCSYCSLLRNDLGDDGLCVENDVRGREQAIATKDLVSYRCHGGLWEAVKPLYADTNLIGFIMIGQVRSAGDIPANKLSRWNKAFGDRQLSEAWEAVPFVQKTKIEHILPLFSSLVDLIIERNMIAILGRRPLDSLIARISAHPEEDLSLADIAEQLGKSLYRTAHLFNEAYGKSFKVLQRELRMRKAAALAYNFQGTWHQGNSRTLWL
ncbi:hypothetical protein MASR2M78_18580 [Treponema sp.]